MFSSFFLSSPYASEAAVGSLMMRRTSAGVFRCLTLRIVEVGRDGDDRLGDRLAELRLGVRLQLGEDHRRDLRRGEGFPFAADLDLDMGVAVAGLDHLVGHALLFLGDLRELAAHKTFHREDRVLRVRDRLALGGLADQ